MKRCLVLILTLALLLSALPFTFAAGPAAQLQAVLLCGDTNGDGIVNAKDVTVLRRYLAGGYGITMDERVGDTSGEGVVNAKDVTILRRYLAGGYGIELGTIVDDPARTYTGAVTGGTLYEDLGAPTFGAGAYKLMIAVDGVEKSEQTAASYAAKIVAGGAEYVTVDGSFTKVWIDEARKLIRIATDVLFLDGTSRRATTLRFSEAGAYRLLGRAAQDATGVLCDWSADGLEFTADCRGAIYLTVSSSADLGSSPLAFYTIVDGEPGERIIFKKGTSTKLVYENVLPGRHTIRIVKDTAITGSTDRLLSVDLIADPDSIRPTAQKEKLVEVIGDSITCGYGILPTSNMDSTSGTASAVMTFGYRVADALGYDYRIIGKGSIGFVVQTGTPKYNMLELYGYQNRYRDGTTPADMSRKADLILIPLGVNDGTRTDDLEAAVREFIATLRSIHGENVPIVLQYDLMNPRIEWLYQKLSAEMENTYVLHMTENRVGAANHPNLPGHNQFTRETLEFLREKGLA